MDSPTFSKTIQLEPPALYRTALSDVLQKNRRKRFFSAVGSGKSLNKRMDRIV